MLAAIPAGLGFISAGLELGGKDPAYVRSDCNLNHAIENLVDGSYFNSGQSCCGIERIYVDEKIYDQFVEGFKNTTEKYILGNPLEKETNLGPVVKLKAAKYIRSQVSKAINLGAKNIVNEKIFKMDDGSNCYVGPSALVDVDHSMEFMKEETFGPTVGIMKVSNEKEVIQLMNDSDYGLTASVWTSDTEFAKDMGSKIETGTFFMNRCDYLDPGLAWTGVKDTGIGVTLSVLGFDHLTNEKTFSSTIYELKAEQSYIQATYEKLHQISQKVRKSGDEVNIIINKRSALSAKRHLWRVPYRSLIEYEAVNNQFIVKDGANKKTIYAPRIGDIVANIAKDLLLINPILAQFKVTEIFIGPKQVNTPA